MYLLLLSAGVLTLFGEEKSNTFVDSLISLHQQMDCLPRPKTKFYLCEPTNKSCAYQFKMLL